MKHNKRMMTLLLAGCMAASMVPAAAAAEAQTETVSQITAQTQAQPFSDVRAGAWYYDAVKYVSDHHLMTGVSPTKFQPNGTMTRAMTAQILYNKSGKPAVKAKQSAFADVPVHKWYFRAVQWAYEQGYASGVGGGRFHPEQNVTREELIQFLYNYDGKPAVSGSLSGFQDGGSVTWSKKAMVWATGRQLISGIRQKNGALILHPRGNALRAQAASVLRVYCQPEFTAYRKLLRNMKNKGRFLQYAHMIDLNRDGTEELMLAYDTNQFRLYTYKNGAAREAAKYRFRHGALWYGDEVCKGKTWSRLCREEPYARSLMIEVNPKTKVVTLGDVPVTNWEEYHAQIFFEKGKWILHEYRVTEPQENKKSQYYIDGKKVTRSEYEASFKGYGGAWDGEGIDDQLSALVG